MDFGESLMIPGIFSASAGAYSGRCHASGMESFAWLVGDWGPLTNLAFWQEALS